MPGKVAASIFAFTLGLAVLTASPGPVFALEKAGGGGIFGENPVAERIADLECGTMFSLAPLFTWWRGGKFHATSVLWPIFEVSETKWGRSTTAFRPLFELNASEPDNYTSVNLLLYLFNYTERNESRSVHFYPLFSFARDKTGGHQVVFPFYWHYWDNAGSGFYWWPFYGQSRQEGYEWTSIAFPLYLESHDEKRGSSYHFLWPVFNYYSGPGRWGFRIFPLVFFNREEDAEPYPHWADRTRAPSEKTPSLRENADERLVPLEPLPGFCYRKKRNDYLVIFPFYWDFHFGDTTYFHLWPFFGYDTGTRGQRRYSVLFPFFRYMTQEMGDRVEIWCPWPVVRYESGDRKVTVKEEGKTRIIHGREGNFDVLFLFSYRSDPSRTEVHLYPLFRNITSLALFRWRDFDVPGHDKGFLDLQVLAFLFKLQSLRDGEKTFFSLELNPLFQYNVGNVYDFEKNEFSGETETSWNVLLGLFGYHRTGGESRYRFLWLIRL